jgi:hypothetical protein
MIPIELIIIGSILSILNLAAHLLRHLPKFQLACDRLDKSKRKLQSIRDSISNKTDNSMVESNHLDGLNEAIDIAEEFIDMLGDITFNKPI